MKIVTKLILKAEEEIKSKLKVINKDIEDFEKPEKIPSVLDMQKREEYFKERMSGRLSTDALTKNYEEKLKLKNELSEIEMYKYQHKEEFASEDDNEQGEKE